MMLKSKVMPPLALRDGTTGTEVQDWREVLQIASVLLQNHDLPSEATLTTEVVRSGFVVARDQH